MKSSVEQYVVGLCIHLHKFLIIDKQENVYFIHHSNNKHRTVDGT